VPTDLPFVIPDLAHLNTPVSKFRHIVHGRAGRYFNMAADEALLRLVELPVLRLYRWAEPDAISIGYFEKAADVPAGRPFVRRYTGGGLVDHSHDLTYTLALPKSHPLTQAGTGPSYQAIHRAVAEALARHGFDVHLTPVNDPTDHPACFQKAVRFDVVDGRGRKLAGAAQRRTREGCLHQGSILPGAPFDWDSLAQALTNCLTDVLGAPPMPSALSEAEAALAAELESTRYATSAWNDAR
jgi:lipoate-protein ligase A